MFRYSFLLLLAVKAAATSYKECTQCEYVNQPKPFSRDFNIIADTSFDQSCVANEYTSFPYCIKKACNRQADNSYKNFLHYPCERYMAASCPNCGAHGRCVNSTRQLIANGYCKNDIRGPITVRNIDECAKRAQHFVINKDHDECYQLGDFEQCDRSVASAWLDDYNYDTYMVTHVCVCDDGWSGTQCDENDECCDDYSVECLACKAGVEPWEFCSNLLNVPPYNVQQASELGCAHILESKSGITGLEYKHLSFVCDGPEDDASATWKVDGETCQDYARQIAGTDIWRCAASGHIDYSNHQLPLPNEVCCACGYKIPKTAVDCVGQWTDKGIHGEDCGTYIITTEHQGAGKPCTIAAGTTVSCSTEKKDCVGVWTEVGPKGDQCGKFIITQQAQGGGRPCLSENGDTRECELGESCRLTGGEDVKDGWAGLDTGDNYCNSCNCNDGVLLCTLMYCSGDRPCELTGGQQVAPGWIGQDTGDNYCNTCQCKDGSLLCTKMKCPPRCPIPGCIPPPEGCKYTDSPELDDEGCPKYPCGILSCEENHPASIERMYMTRDRGMVTLYYTGGQLNSYIGIVHGLQYSRQESIPLTSRHIVDKNKIVDHEGHINLAISHAGGPFFATMWNASGYEIASRKLFDKFSPEFLAGNCPKQGEADRQYPWDDAQSLSGGVSHTCSDYGKFSTRDQLWLCDTTQAGWDSDRDYSTAINTCCVCDYTGSLYYEWANAVGKNPYSCDIQCPYIPHFHSITKAFNYLLKTNSSCRTVHLRSCGGEMVWSPCKGPGDVCRYTPASPNTEQVTVIELATQMYADNFDVFSKDQWDVIWGIQEKLNTTKALIDHLHAMHEKIDLMEQYKKELDGIVVPHTLVPDENTDMLRQLVATAKEDLLFRDLTTYPRLITRLNEISRMIQEGEENVSNEIRHAMRYDLTVLIEDVNVLEEESRTNDKNLDNRTASLEINQEKLIKQLWELEQSHVGLSDMVQYEINYVRNELNRQNASDEQLFARVAELTVIAAEVQELLYKNAMNDSRHDDAIAALQGELKVLSHWVDRNVTAFEIELKEIARQGERLHWEFDSHVEAVAWAIRDIREHVDDTEEDVLSRLNIMEKAYQEVSENVGESVRFIDRKVNEMYEAILNKASTAELRKIEETIILTELALKNYSQIQGELAFNKSSVLVDELREAIFQRFNDLGNMPTEAEIQLMIKQSYDESVAYSTSYADNISAQVFDLANDTIYRLNDEVYEYVTEARTYARNITDEAKQYAKEMADNARMEAISFSQGYVNDIINNMVETLSQNFTSADEVRDIIVDMFPDIDERIEAIAERERNAMFLSVEERAKELEAYAATIAEAHAVQARINATNTAVFMIDELRNELNEVNTSLYTEFSHFAYKIPDMELMITHLYNEMTVIHTMIDVVENDIVRNNNELTDNVDDLRKESEQEIAIVRHRLNLMIEDVNEFKEDVATKYVSKENFEQVQKAFEQFVTQEEQRYQENLEKFNTVHHTIDMLDSKISMVVISQDQKILFLADEIQSLENIASGHSDDLDDIKKQLGVLNKIQEDYPSIDLSNQLSELHIKTVMASQDIIKNRQDLMYAFSNITELSEEMGHLNFNVSEQRRQILEMQNTILYGIPPNNLWNSIDNIRNELDNKLDHNDMVQIQEEFDFQRDQLLQLNYKIESIKNGTNVSGIDLETMARLQQLEESIQTLLNSPFGCGTQEVDFSCEDFITGIMNTFLNTTINMTSNEVRVEEIFNALNSLGDEVADLRHEYDTLISTMGTEIPYYIVRDLQERIANVSSYLMEMDMIHKNETRDMKTWIANIANDVQHLIKVSLSNSDEISKLNYIVRYLNITYAKLPNIYNILEGIQSQVDEIRHFYGESLDRNQRAIDDLQEKIDYLLPTLNTLGYKQELYQTQLTLEMEQIRNEFLDLPDSPRIQNFIGDLDEKIRNISLEVVKVSTEQQHFNYQVGQLDAMRSDIRSLQNMTESLYNMTLNQSYSMVLNVSDLDSLLLNETLVPLIRRIDVLESVVSAHQAMNFSRQIEALATTIKTHTSNINNLMAQVNGTIHLTNEQLNDLAHRLSILEPTQEVLQIRDDLNRLIRLEEEHPLINISREISQLDTRISVYETLLPPETLEAIMKDIKMLKEKLANNSMLNDGEILIIQAQIRQLVAAAEKHTDDIDELRDITALLDDASTDHETALAEIEIELDTLEHAINTIITNGNVGDLGIPNEIQKLHDEDQKTRDMVHYLESQLDELKHQLRYYSACTHSADCRPGQRCSHSSECLWEPGSVVCAWEKLDCAKKCHHSGDCNMLKHVWKKEFKSHCQSGMSCGSFYFGNDDLNITLNGPEHINLLLGYNFEDPWAVCSDSRFKYKVEREGYLDVNDITTTTFKYKCADKYINRTVSVIYPECDPNVWIMCNGHKAYPSKFHNCSIPCKEKGCDKEYYAGPSCKCSPFSGACEDWLGPAKATWDGEKCGCECLNDYMGKINNKNICN